jgi:hypothetical protein
VRDKAMPPRYDLERALSQARACRALGHAGLTRFLEEQKSETEREPLLPLSSGGSSRRRGRPLLVPHHGAEECGGPPVYFAPWDSYPRRGPRTAT